MPHKRITNNEIELSFERFLIDAEDDFFPDPIQYEDLRLIRNEIIREIKQLLIQALTHQSISYSVKTHYDWDLPKSNFVIRQARALHPIDSIIFHFILNRLIPLIEPNLSISRYSYIIKNSASRKLYGRPTENWLKFKNDIKEYFKNNPDYKYMVSTDIAGFFEYLPIILFKKQLLQLCKNNEKNVIELLNMMARAFSPSSHSGLPQNCDPFSYLCTAFLDCLDKELEAQHIKHFRYVDDIRVACKTKNEAKLAIVSIIRSLRKVNLNLSTAKTDIISVEDEKYKNFIKEFPIILTKLDKAIAKRQKEIINQLSPTLVEVARKTIKDKKNFNDRLFRACLWRILKIHRFKNVNKLNITPIIKACLKLLLSKPEHSQTFLRFIILHKNRKYVQNTLLSVLKECVYPWQEMLIWHLLVQSDVIKNSEILDIARVRIRDNGYHEAVRNYIMLFLGKHGHYHDREYIAGLFHFTQSFRAKRSILIAIQEYPDRNTIYNQILSSNSDITIISIVKYIKQLNKAHYVKMDNTVGSIIARY